MVPSDDGDDIALGQDHDGSLVIALEGHLPAPPRSADIDLGLFERWRPAGGDQWTCAEYRYELRHRERDHRRAFHRHDEEHFLRAYGVATHEHCEAVMGVEVCAHYYGQPGARRLRRLPPSLHHLAHR